MRAERLTLEICLFEPVTYDGTMIPRNQISASGHLPPSGLVQVHVVHSDTGTANDAQLLARGHHLLGHRGAAAGN